MNMRTVTIEGADKIESALPREPKPLEMRQGASNTTPFSRMLDGSFDKVHKTEREDKAINRSESDTLPKTKDSGDKADAKSKDALNASNTDRASKGKDNAAEGNVGEKEKDEKDALKASEAAEKNSNIKGKRIALHNEKGKKGIIEQGKAESNRKDVKGAEEKEGKYGVKDISKVHTKGKETYTKASGKKEGEKGESSESIKNALCREKEDSVKEGEKGLEENASNIAVIDMRKTLLQEKGEKDTGTIAKTAESVKVLDTKDNAVDGAKKSAKGSKRKGIDKDGKITVIDIRSENDKERREAVEEEKGESLLSKAQGVKGSENEVSFSAADAAKENITSSNTQTAASSGSTFQAMVENQIRENTPEIVKTGTLLLRDNNVGTINLVMHPENLGNVRIVLHLADNMISGQITVHSEEAYNAFKNSAFSLSQAFNDSGFNSQGFTVAYSGSGQGGGEGQGQNAEQQQYNLIADKAERGYGSASQTTSVMEGGREYRSDYSVNIVA